MVKYIRHVFLILRFKYLMYTKKYDKKYQLTYTFDVWVVII